MNLHDIEVRPAVPAEAAAIRDLHLASLRSLCASHYSPEQIETWARLPPLAHCERMVGELVTVAVRLGVLVGFAQMDSSSGLIQYLFVHPDYVRQKIGTHLLLEMHSTAYAAKLPRLTVCAPLNAVEFFRYHDFTEIGPDFIPLPDGARLPGLKMEQAVYRMLEFSPEQTIPERLRIALACDDRMCMLETLRALREQAPRELLQEIVGLLHHPDRKIRRRAGVTLGTFSKLKSGEVTVEQKAQELADYLLHGPDEAVRLSCAIHLMPVYNEIVDDAFVRALRDSDEKIVRLACSGIGHRGNDRSLEALFDLLTHSHWQIRLAACMALINQKQADGRVVAALETMSRDPEAAAYDAEMVESREFRNAMGQAFCPDAEKPAPNIETFGAILAQAREIAKIPNPKSEIR